MFFSRHGAPKDKVSFLCVRRFMFTWAMDHGYEIIALAAQPPEPKHAKCINADKNRMPGTNHQCNKRSWNDISQLILWIYLHQANRYELRPAIPVQPSELKCTNNMIYYSETVEFYTRFWNDISQLILWIYLHWGLGYELRPHHSYTTFWTKMTKPIWFITPKRVNFA